MPGPQRYHHNTRDGNEEPLLKLAEQLGGCWREGPPLDGWIWVPRIAKWMPVEIKLPEREGHAAEFTPAQVQFRAWCERNHAPHWIWRTGEDVLRDFGVSR